MSNNIIFEDLEKYQCYKFDADNLLNALDNGIYPRDKIEESKLYKYLKEYFTYESEEKSQAQMIIVEKQYMSESYLNDLRLFYWSNFKNYDKFCRRLHFFSKHFTQNELEERILDRDEDFFKKYYLGYLIVKPTGNSLLGPTFLKTYGKSANFEREYNSVVKMNVSLFGIDIEIEGLVFQEQDGAIGVCATQALWSALNKLSVLFRVPMLSPSEISSFGGIGSKGRVFPSSGLSNEQIFKIFRKAGLTVEFMALSQKGRNKLDKNLLKEIVYAYNRIGIPILLGYYSVQEGSDNFTIETQRHIVTVMGYRVDEIKSKKTSKYRTKVFANKIYRLYVHNDQIGPYTKIGFYEKETNREDEIQSNFIGKDCKNVVYDSLLIPLKKSIRIRYQDVYETITKLNRYVNRALNDCESEAEWDIYLEKGTRYKNDVLSRNLDAKHKLKISTESFPKYIWVGRLFIKSIDNERELIFDVIFDSSESPMNFCIHRVFYFELKTSWGILNVMKEDFNDPIFTAFPKGRLSKKHIIEFESEFSKSKLC